MCPVEGLRLDILGQTAVRVKHYKTLQVLFPLQDMGQDSRLGEKW